MQLIDELIHEVTILPLLSVEFSHRTHKTGSFRINSQYHVRLKKLIIYLPR